MEHVDGLTATQQITTAWPLARVLVVTSYTDNDLREAAQRAGACGYIAKENLLEIRKWLRSRRSEYSYRNEYMYSCELSATGLVFRQSSAAF
jgi:DNA-binding NarL/FixJ family response regulator